jgi:hypothetical protein
VLLRLLPELPLLPVVLLLPRLLPLLVLLKPLLPRQLLLLLPLAVLLPVAPEWRGDFDKALAPQVLCAEEEQIVQFIHLCVGKNIVK